MQAHKLAALMMHGSNSTQSWQGIHRCPKCFSASHKGLAAPCSQTTAF